MNYIRELKTLEEFATLGSLFGESLAMLKSPTGANMVDLTEEELSRTIILLTLDKTKGTVLVLENKRKLPLGYITLHDVTQPFQAKTMQVGYLYSNEKCPSTLKELAFEARIRARQLGFTHFQFVLHRTSGSGIRMVNTILNMKRKSLLFSDTL